MIQIALNDSPPSVSECCTILARHTQEFGIPLDYDRLLEYYYYYTIQAEERKRHVARYLGLNMVIKDTDIIGWIRKLGKGFTGFLSTDSGAVSLSEESIDAAIVTGIYGEEANAILKMYSEAKKLAHMVSPFPKIIMNHEVDKRETYDGHRMIICHPKWVPQNTGRIGMTNPGLMNVAKVLADIETVPKGWVYITADSGQIEPRIIQSAFLNDPQIKKCTMLYGDAYFGYVHYCTVLTEEERASGTLDIKPVELSDEIRAKRKKFKTYGNAVMYGSTENRDRDPDKAAFIKYIGGHPNRVKWQREVEQKIEGGCRTFKSVFGTEINITAGPSESCYRDKTSNAYFSHLVKCAINNPIQATAADLMRFSIAKANDILIRNSDNSYILRYTHDSGTFAVHEDDYGSVAEQLKGVTSYQVADWIPINSDPVEGIPQSGNLPRLVV